MNPQQAYEELVRRMQEQARLSSCDELLGWDELTYLPSAGAAHRARQRSLLARLCHEQSTHPRMGELLAKLEASDLVSDPESAAAITVRDMRWSFDRLRRLPPSLVEEIAEVTSLAEQAWIVARQRNDFGHFRPSLDRVFVLKRQEAECYGFRTTAYDALLEDYEFGVTTADLIGLFESLRHALVPLVPAVVERQGQTHVEVLFREYPIDRQRTFGERVAATVGYDLRCGRLDTSVHPFSSHIGPGDCRITTRFKPHDFSEGFFSILHETGHALYDQGLPAEHFGTPLGVAASIGVHESQARLWEIVIGRSRAFWAYWFPLLREMFPEVLGDVSSDQFHRAVNHIEPGLSRVRADEITYNLHILIRFELERALLSGDLAVCDLPAAWAEHYRRDLGVAPANDLEGCLQDGHWAAGLIGYFPTYTLGNIYAARLYARLLLDIPDLGEQLARGEFRGLLIWLRENVHCRGQRCTGPELIRRITGAALDASPLLDQLQHRLATPGVSQ